MQISHCVELTHARNLRWLGACRNCVTRDCPDLKQDVLTGSRNATADRMRHNVNGNANVDDFSLPEKK